MYTVWCIQNGLHPAKGMKQAGGIPAYLVQTCCITIKRVSNKLATMKTRKPLKIKDFLKFRNNFRLYDKFQIPIGISLQTAVLQLKNADK